MSVHHNRWWVLAVGLLAAASAVAEERLFDKKFPATSGGTLTVETDTGAVTVSGSDAKEVVVHAVMRGSRGALDNFDISAEGNSESVLVRGRRSTESWLSLSWVFGNGLDLHYTIQVPRDYHVQVRTAGGDLELRNFNGRAHGRTSGGNVLVTAINGDVQIQTSGGNIRATQLIGDVRVGTSGGEVRLEKVQGAVDARTSGGNVHLIDIDGKLQAKTSGGNVIAELTGVNRGVDLRTSGGDVTVTVPKQFAAQLEASTSGGEVECDLPVTTTGSTQSKHRHALYGALNGGGNLLKATTSGGDIEIRARM